MILEVEQLTKQFGAFAALDGVDLSVEAGENVGVVGPNGAGKTTFLNVITGYLAPTSGVIRYNGSEISGLGPRQLSLLGVARSFQIPQLFAGLTVLENVLLPLAVRDGATYQIYRKLRTVDREQRAREVLALFGLDSVADEPMSVLSEGSRKVLDIAVSFASDPKLMLLDEPTSSVSVKDKYKVMDTLDRAMKAGSVTTIFVEHDMDVVARYATRVVVVADGRAIADGSPTDVLDDLEIKRIVAGWTSS